MTYSAKRVLRTSACIVGLAACFGASPSFADENLQQLSKDPNQWVMPLGNYSSQRYSEPAGLRSAARRRNPI